MTDEAITEAARQAAASAPPISEATRRRLLALVRRMKLRQQREK